jgi:pilus assembly protein CpaC
MKNLLTSLLPLALSAFVTAPAYAADNAKTPVIDVGVGQSVVQRDTRAIARILISDPAVAELRLLEEGQYQVRGLAVGSTDLWVWYRDDVQHPVTFQVVVGNDLTDLTRRIAATVSGPAPRVYAVKDRIVVEGVVPDLETMERVAAVARIYDENFVNLLTVQGDQQVQLRVVFAEVNRTGMRQLGINLFGNIPGFEGILTGPNESTSTANVYAAPGLINEPPTQVIGAPGTAGFNIVGYLYGATNTAALISVLEQQAVAHTLAQPTLTALSGQEAQFLSGGEIPIPVSQTNQNVSIQFKDYGVKLGFVPTVLADDVIDLRANVEVSAIDRTTSVRSAGIEVPGLSTRKAESHLRLGSGMTFAMAGMLNETTTATRQQIPILGDIPLVGSLFRYVNHSRAETELVIFVTPELVRPLTKGEVPAPPGTTENYNPNDLELFLLGSLTHGGSRTAEPTGPGGMYR